MIPVSLRLKNFRSFRDEVFFEFPRGPGLYFMRGENHAEPRLEANGAGKSTLFEALCWCLYGKTSRGLKAGDVSTWSEGRATVVEFEFAITEHAEPHVLRRTWKPNTLTLDGEDIAKLNVENVVTELKLGFAPFLHSVFLAQSQPMFLDLKAEAKAAMFSEVLGLDKWLEYSARASEKAKAQDGVTRRLERDLAEIDGELRALKIDTSDASAAEWEAERDKELADLEAEYAKLMHRSDTLKADLKLDAEEEERRCRAKLAEQIERRKSLEAEVEAFRRKHVQPAHDACVTHAARLEDAVRRHDMLLEGECPTCGHEATDDEVGRAEQEWRRLFDKSADLVSVREARTAELDKKKALVEAAATAEDKARTAMDRAVATTSQLRNDLQRNERALDNIEERADEIAKKLNPFRAQQERVARRLEARALQRKDLGAAIDASQSKAALYQFWVRGFKELRLQLIGEALAALEVEGNSSLVQLGLADWEITFDVDRETKGGGIARGFSVRVTAPASTVGGVPWEAWSGGEAQRLRVGAQMGLANLIRDQSGTALALEVWDEPTQGLSAQGVQDLLDALHRRAIECGRQIWLVDHRALAYGNFAGVATVVKDDNGSRIVWGSPAKEITYDNRSEALPNIERTRRRYAG